VREPVRITNNPKTILWEENTIRIWVELEIDWDLHIHNFQVTLKGVIYIITGILIIFLSEDGRPNLLAYKKEIEIIRIITFHKNSWLLNLTKGINLWNGNYQSKIYIFLR